MKKELSATKGGYVSVQGQKLPIYIIPEVPFWFVPSPSASEILDLCNGKLSLDDLAISLNKLTAKDILTSSLEASTFVSSITLPPYKPYEGRSTRPLGRLQEIWFHLTDKCNLRCTHCMFGEHLTGTRFLERDTILQAVAQAYDLGCRLICFTGGEPFVYPDFVGLMKAVLGWSDVKLVVLTNGLLKAQDLSRISRLDLERVHLQVSVDGPEESHDKIRGKGTYIKTLKTIEELLERGISCSVAMSVNEINTPCISELITILRNIGIHNLHLQWHFKRGLGENLDVPETDALISALVAAFEVAQESGISIDNLDAMASQVFSPPGTRYDLGNACWESLAVGPDWAIYPTPAMVERPECIGGHLGQGLERVWRESALFEAIRGMSLMESPHMRHDPWRFIIGGGDIDHCLEIVPGKDIELKLGQDPYTPVYKAMVEFLIQREIRGLPVPEHPGLVLRMGDVSTECPSGEGINFTHCNCLLSVGQGDSRGLVREFYSRRALEADTRIANPVQLGAGAEFIPEEARLRMYGCGSPAQDAGISEGETVLDLGSGSGVECFMASRMVGPKGLVLGLDMTQEMLDIAGGAARKVAKELGYGNVIFLKGYLEEIPLGDNAVDLVMSNCVINLSKNKRRVFSEIFRVLKPGGRLVISDVVTEDEPPASIRADHQLIGECIGGALVEKYLLALLGEIGFMGAKILGRFPYREVQGHGFHSLTFLARKPDHASGHREEQRLLYSGPFQALVLDGSEILRRGHVVEVAFGDASTKEMAESGVLVIDKETAMVTNVEMANRCSCCGPPEGLTLPNIDSGCQDTHVVGCLICGEPLIYFTCSEMMSCSICGSKAMANAMCTKGHFVCDACHMKDPLAKIREICTTTTETDMLALLKNIHSQHVSVLHGPEHHAMVPGIILSTYRNLGGELPKDAVETGIKRGSEIPGGACGFMGSCGAAIGVGIAFSIILGASPLTPRPRKQVMGVVGEILKEISRLKAARCCLRESYLSLRQAARMSEGLLPLTLKAHEALVCNQYLLNKECIKRACPLYPSQGAKPLESPFPMLGKG